MLAEKGLGDTSPSSPPPPPSFLLGSAWANPSWRALVDTGHTMQGGECGGAGGAPLTHHYWNLTMCYVLRVETTACYGGDQRQ